MSKKGDYQIPFDQFGNQMYYEESYYVPNSGAYTRHPPIMQDNVEHTDTLRLICIEKGNRSGVHAKLMNAAGQRRFMFLSTFNETLPAFLQSGGTLTGTWVFRKQGQNYGIVPVQLRAKDNR